MNVVQTNAMDSEIALIGFAAGDTQHPNAFVLINIAPHATDVAVTLSGTQATSFACYRTTDEKERFQRVAPARVAGNVLRYSAPARSATTFIGIQP
jgi:hypothetical protein